MVATFVLVLAVRVVCLALERRCMLALAARAGGRDWKRKRKP